MEWCAWTGPLPRTAPVRVERSRDTPQLATVRPDPVEPKASELPFVLSLSKDTYRREAWFDKLSANRLPNDPNCQQASLPPHRKSAITPP